MLWNPIVLDLTKRGWVSSWYLVRRIVLIDFCVVYTENPQMSMTYWSATFLHSCHKGIIQIHNSIHSLYCMHSTQWITRTPCYKETSISFVTIDDLGRSLLSKSLRLYFWGCSLWFKHGAFSTLTYLSYITPLDIFRRLVLSSHIDPMRQEQVRSQTFWIFSKSPIQKSSCFTFAIVPQLTASFHGQVLQSNWTVHMLTCTTIPHGSTLQLCNLLLLSPWWEQMVSIATGTRDFRFFFLPYESPWGGSICASAHVFSSQKRVCQKHVFYG